MENRVLYAGFASVKVTPPMGNPIPGYYHKRYSEGFLTDLYLRATAFSDGENKAVIFACDAIGMKGTYFDILNIFTIFYNTGGFQNEENALCPSCRNYGSRNNYSNICLG